MISMGSRNYENTVKISYFGLASDLSVLWGYLVYEYRAAFSKHLKKGDEEFIVE